MFCMYCGKEIPTGAAFCPACGKAVSPAQPPSLAEGTIPAESAVFPGEAAPAAESTGGAAPAAKKKSRLPLFLGVAAAGIAMIAGVVLLITGLRHLGGGSETGPAVPPPVEETIAALSAAEEAASETEAEAESEAPPEAVSGERLYTGSSSGEGLGSITISFVLTEKKDEIHDMKIEVKDFKGKTSNVTVELSGATQTISGSYPVDYSGDNRDISIGKNVIEELRFREDGSAYLRFTFTFYQVGIGATPTIEIPVPGLEFELHSTAWDGAS